METTKYTKDRFYLYRHVQKFPKNVFYVGIGSYTSIRQYKSWKTNYSRAFSIKSRNRYWAFIAKKYPYSVDILFESNDLEEIRVKEREFINLYGRRDLNTGTLVNQTDGGEGCFGCIPPQHARQISSDKHSRKVYQYSINNEFIKEWKSATLAGKMLNIVSTNITKCINNNAYHAGGFLWKKEITTEVPNIRRVIKNRKIVQFSLDAQKIKVWNSAKEVSKALGFSSSSLTSCCKNKIKTMYGYIWKYLEESHTVQPIIKNKCEVCYVCGNTVFVKYECRKCYSKRLYKESKSKSKNKNKNKETNGRQF